MANKKQNKIKILVWGDTPYCSTGFGTVVRGVFGYLARTGKYQIDIIGINDTGGHKDYSDFPNMRVWPALPSGSQGGDFHGRGRLVTTLFNQDQEIVPPWDIVFTLNDPFILDQRFRDGLGVMKQIIRAQLSYLLQSDPSTWFKIVSYWPIDSRLHPNWVSDTISLPDMSVAYSNYGFQEILRANRDLKEKMSTTLENKMVTIYHGYDDNNFYPISDEDRKQFRNEFFEGKVKDSTFLVSVVARNQMRKDLPRALKIFAEFKKKRPDSMLYINAKETDAWGSLREYGYELGLEMGTDFMVPSNFNERTGLSIEMLNGIYNASDVILSTNLGEGWGLSFSEAMGANTLTLAPHHTTAPEIFGVNSTDINLEARGITYKSGSTKSEWMFLGPQDLMRERPLGNVDDAVEKLLWIYDHPEEAKQIANNGHEWVKQYTWDNVAGVWDVLFEKVYKQLNEDRKNHKEIRKELVSKLGLDKNGN